MDTPPPNFVKAPDELNNALQLLKHDLPIVFLERLGGKLTVPISEIDGAGRFFMTMRLVKQDGVECFEFENHNKPVTG